MNTKLKNTVDAKLFYEALSKASKALDKSSVPVLENAKITFSHEKCTITGTNLECWLEANIPACGDAFSLILSNTKSMLKACKYFAGDDHI